VICRAVLLAGVVFLAPPLLVAQVPPEERIPIRDPDRLESLGLPRDAESVSIWSRSDRNRGAALDEKEVAAPETWGTTVGYSTVAGYQLTGWWGLYLAPDLEHIPSYAPSGAVYCSDEMDPDFVNFAVARIEVPDGVLLDRIHWWSKDSSPSEDLGFTLYETCQQPGDATPSATVLAEGSTEGSGGDQYSFRPLDGRRANPGCLYTAQVKFRTSGEGCPAGRSLEVRKISVQWHRQVSPAPATATFSDVATSHPYFRHIEALFDSGITSGCQEAGKRLAFCPDRSITRGEMAVFLAKALGLSGP
jgi:hypothetical protein